MRSDLTLDVNSAHPWFEYLDTSKATAIIQATVEINGVTATFTLDALYEITTFEPGRALRTEWIHDR